MKRFALLLIGLAFTPLPASAWQKCQYFSDGREPRCHVASDGKGQPYVDGRRRSTFERYRQHAAHERTRKRREIIGRHRAMQEGRTHTQDMATGGTPSSVGVISPFVPGSIQDRSWQLERKRRGLCGNDQRCLNTR